jgi:hypothetical protein
MSGTNQSKNNRKLLIEALMAGLTKHFAGQTIPVNGGSFTTEALVAKLNNYLTQQASADAANAAWKTQLDAVDALATAETDPLVLSLHSYVRGVLGASSQSLQDFGLKPRKKTVRSSAEKAVTAQKSAATKVARHTLSPKQKKAIHGEPPAPSSPPPVTPSAAPGGSTK